MAVNLKGVVIQILTKLKPMTMIFNWMKALNLTIKQLNYEYNRRS